MNKYINSFLAIWNLEITRTQRQPLRFIRPSFHFKALSVLFITILSIVINSYLWEFSPDLGGRGAVCLFAHVTSKAAVAGLGFYLQVACILYLRPHFFDFEIKLGRDRTRLVVSFLVRVAVMLSAGFFQKLGAVSLGISTFIIYKEGNSAVAWWLFAFSWPFILTGFLTTSFIGFVLKTRRKVGFSRSFGNSIISMLVFIIFILLTISMVNGFWQNKLAFVNPYECPNFTIKWE